MKYFGKFVAYSGTLSIQEWLLYVQESVQNVHLLLCYNISERQTMPLRSAVLAFLLFLWALQESIFWSKENGLRRQIPWCYLCSWSAGELCYNGVPVCSVSSESITSELGNFFSGKHQVHNGESIRQDWFFAIAFHSSGVKARHQFFIKRNRKVFW